MSAIKILVVDDEPDLEILIRQKFRNKIKAGEFEFVFAGNGQEALERVRADASIELVMSDINMPVMDGLTFLLRISDINRILKTVIVSAYGDMQNIRTAMNRGAYDFLIKPIDFEDFEITVKKTLHTLEEIKKGAQAREHLTAIQCELNVAARIQSSILPRVFPPFPGRKEFSIFAKMEPARSVGGDFYDFFLIDENRLGFVIGDVSGKGVPAAILMAVSRTLLRSIAMQGVSPGECLERLNAGLERQNEDSMFVTIFYGILHPDTGLLEFSVAGHNPPYLFSSSEGVARMAAQGGIVAGLIEGEPYDTETLQLKPGDGILLYTDGVTEAADTKEQEFTESRLAATLDRAKAEPVEEIVRKVFADVEGFAAGAPQRDDITAMALRYEGSAGAGRIAADQRKAAASARHDTPLRDS